MKRERITITIRKDVIAKIDSTIDGVKVRNRSNAIETIIEKEFKKSFLHQAVILGGDNGVKINGKLIPKILIPLEGSTLVENNIETLKSYGVSEIIIDVAGNNLDDVIKAKLGNGSRYNVEIIYRKNMGTGSILRDAKNSLTNTFLMVNGDILLGNIDFEDMYRNHKKNGGWGTIAVATSSDPKTLGSIHMKGQSIENFYEKTKKEAEHTHLVSAGVYMLEPKVSSIVSGKSSERIMVEDAVFPKLARAGKLYGYQIGNWVHLHDEEKLKEYLKKNRKK